MPVGTYIACSDPLTRRRRHRDPRPRAAVCDTNFVLDYFRTTNDHRMLYGGRVSYSTGDAVAGLAEQHAPAHGADLPAARDGEGRYAWGGFVDISMNRRPTSAACRHRPWPVTLPGASRGGLAIGPPACSPTGRVAEVMAGDASSAFDVFAG